MADTAPWEFKQWCEEYELTEETVKLLQSKGFTSYKTISKLDQEKVNQFFGKALGSMPAQLLMLEEAVNLINPAPTQNETQGRRDPAARRTTTPAANATEETDDPISKLTKGGTLSAQEVAKLLQSNSTLANAFIATAPTAQPEATPGELITFSDPYQFGCDQFASKKRQVVDFVSCLSRGEESTVVNLGGIEFRSTAARKPQHDRLSVPQYMEGSLRLLRAIILEDGASTEHIMDYINYMVQIAVFAQTYAWPSVLAYDIEYRAQQQDLGFRWGTGSAFLMSSRLQKSAPITAKKNNTAVKSSQSRDPKTGAIICQRYNGVNGCTLAKCNYAHVCRACFADHPEWQQHRQNRNTNHTTPADFAKN